MRKLDLELFKKIPYEQILPLDVVVALPEGDRLSILKKVLHVLPSNIKPRSSLPLLIRVYSRKGLPLEKFIETLNQVPLEYQEQVKEEIFTIYDYILTNIKFDSPFYNRFDLNFKEENKDDISMNIDDVITSLQVKINIKTEQDFTKAINILDNEFIDLAKKNDNDSIIKNLLEKYIVYLKRANLNE